MIPIDHYLTQWCTMTRTLTDAGASAQSVSVQQIRDIVKGIKGNQNPGPPTGSGSGSPLRRSSTSVGQAAQPHLDRKDS